MADPRVEVVGQLSEDEVRAVSELVEAATEADGVRPLSEHVMLHLRYGGDAPVRNVLIYGREGGSDGRDGGSDGHNRGTDDRGSGTYGREGGSDGREGGPGGGQGADTDFADRLAAYGHLDVTDEVAGASAEVVVHPLARRRGLGHLLVATTVAETPDGRLRLWSHGEHPGAAALALSMGFSRSRVLWQMRRSLYAALPEPQLPDGVSVRTFEPGRDDDAWVRLNALAFRGHPEQGGWDADDLHRRMREPWFDPAGFFLATRPADDGAERLVGFHWTKVHGGQEHHGVTGPHAHDGHGHDLIGEVYVVGIDPAERGTGLGRALTVTGLRYLRHRGLPDAMLYVDADNDAAIALYRRLDFTRWETDVMFSRDSAAIRAGVS